MYSICVPIQLGLTADQRLFHETTARFIQAELPISATREWHEDPVGYDPGWLKKAAEIGWFAMLVPEADGGGSVSGAGLSDAAIVAEEIGRRLTDIFLRGKDGRRPVFGGTRKFQEDPHWRDYLLFNEYFHGDNGAGLGASHQTGWTVLVAKLIELFGRIDERQVLQAGRLGAFAKSVSA